MGVKMQRKSTDCASVKKRKRKVADSTIIGRMARMICMGTGSSMLVLVMVKSLHHKERQKCHHQHPRYNYSLLSAVIHFLNRQVFE